MKFHCHPPGEPSRAAELNIGLLCPYACVFCPHSRPDPAQAGVFRLDALRRGQWHDGPALLKGMEALAAAGFLTVDITGGDPVLYAGLPVLISRARDMGLASRLVTLGTGLAGDGPLRLPALLDAGLTNLLFPVHAADDSLFRALTGAELRRQRAAQDELAGRGFEFTTSTMVVPENAGTLPDIARMLAGTATYRHEFILAGSVHPWNGASRVDGFRLPYHAVLGPLTEAAAILEAAGTAVSIRSAPLCALPGLERYTAAAIAEDCDPYRPANIGLPFDPAAVARRHPTNRGQPPSSLSFFTASGALAGIGVMGARGQGIATVFPQSCAACTVRPACDGAGAGHVRRHGAAPFLPYGDPALAPQADGLLVPPRRGYAPPLLVKRAPDAGMKAVNRRLLAPAPLSGAPQVSIVVTNYNKGGRVRLALESALEQSYGHLEVLLLDDGSTDGSVEALERQGFFHGGGRQTVRLIRQPNSGQPATARNAGIAQASGDLILPLDADDRIAPTYVAEAVGVLRDNPALSIVYCDALYSRRGLIRTRDYDFAVLIRSNHLSYCSLYRRTVFDDIGGYRLNVRGVEDWDFWIAAGARGHFARRIPRPLFFYQESDDGVFARDVAPAFVLKFAQIILNNADLYQPDEIAAARSMLSRPVPCPPNPPGNRP